MPHLAERLEAVNKIIADTAAAAGRQRGEVRVDRRHEIGIRRKSILEAIEEGQLIFGENKVQEAKAKIPLLLPRRAGISSAISRRTKSAPPSRYSN